MTWTALVDFTTGRLVSASDWNKMMGASGNLAETAAAKATTAGQLPYATGAQALSMLSIGAAEALLRSTGSAPTWFAKGADGTVLGVVAGVLAWTTITGAAPGAHATTHQPGGSDAMAVDAAAATGSLRTLGTSATSAAAGNDARLSDARTPTAHATSHNSGGSDAMAIDAAAGTGSLRTLGTAATAACAGNDARLSDSRTPTAHKSNHVVGGSDSFTSGDSLALSSIRTGSDPPTSGAVNLTNNAFVRAKTSGGTDVAVIGLAGDNYVRIFSSSLNIGSTGGVCVGSPTGGDLGAGKLNCQSDVYRNNTAYTNPHGGFEKAYTGKVERFADRMAAMGLADYQPLGLEELEAYTREHYHFPGFADEEGLGLFSGGDRHLLITEELAVHLFRLHHRLAVLEAHRAG